MILDVAACPGRVSPKKGHARDLQALASSGFRVGMQGACCSVPLPRGAHERVNHMEIQNNILRMWSLEGTRGPFFLAILQDITSRRHIVERGALGLNARRIEKEKIRRMLSRVSGSTSKASKQRRHPTRGLLALRSFKYVGGCRLDK